MKKLVIILCGLAICMAGCGKTSSTVSDSFDIDDSAIENVPTVSLAEQMSITEYTCVIDDSFRYYIMFIKNDSEETVNIEANIIATDSEDKPVEAFSDSVSAVAPGQTSCIWTTFEEWETIEGFNYTMSVSKGRMAASIYETVSIDYNLTDTKIVASATNNGDRAAEFVWLDVVFLKNGEMVGFRELSLMDDDGLLLPGRTLFAEGEAFSDTGFDEVAIALNGRIN